MIGEEFRMEIIDNYRFTSDVTERYTLHCVCHCTPPVIVNCADECANFSWRPRKNTIPLSLPETVIIINVRNTPPSIRPGMLVRGKSSESSPFDRASASTLSKSSPFLFDNIFISVFQFSQTKQVVING